MQSCEPGSSIFLNPGDMASESGSLASFGAGPPCELELSEKIENVAMFAAFVRCSARLRESCSTIDCIGASDRRPRESQSSGEPTTE